MLHELRKRVIMHAHGGQLTQEVQVTVRRLGRSTRSMIRQGWLPLCVLVASCGCGGEANLGTGKVDASPEASSDDGPTGDAGPIECRSNSDCSNPSCYLKGYYCQGPYYAVTCACPGIVAMSACTMDSQCDGGSVCREDRSVHDCLISEGLDGGATICAAPCTSDSECAPTDRCEDHGHCVPRTCAECPSYFSCAIGACVIPSCSRDSDCPGGYCVNGSCGSALGVCKHNCV
jgi:hypothetical protein